MLHKIYKIIFADIEKEEEWLNEMAQKGLNFLDNFLMRYTFSEGEPNEFTYRIDLLENNWRNPVSKKYIEFIEETGAECVSTSGRWAYFRKRKAEGPFELFTDIEAKIKYYKRVLAYISTILFFNIVVLVFNTTIGILKSHANLAISVPILGFTILLIKSTIHYVKKIRILKEEKKVHE